MTARHWIAIGALWAALAVTLGAFGAHALRPQLEELGQLEDWHTAVRYQVWHALALVLYGILRLDRPGGFAAAWLLLVGSLFFSGSIYFLCFDIAAGLLWPVTPTGGLLLIVGWVVFAIQALRLGERRT